MIQNIQVPSVPPALPQLQHTQFVTYDGSGNITGVYSVCGQAAEVNAVKGGLGASVVQNSAVMCPATLAANFKVNTTSKTLQGVI